MKFGLNFHTALFIDPGVDNYQELFDGVIASATAFRLDSASARIERIDQIFQQYPQTETV